MVLQYHHRSHFVNIRATALLRGGAVFAPSLAAECYEAKAKISYLAEFSLHLAPLSKATIPIDYFRKNNYNIKK